MNCRWPVAICANSWLRNVAMAAIPKPGLEDLCFGRNLARGHPESSLL